MKFKFKKVLALALAAITATAAMSMSAFAAETEKLTEDETTLTFVDGMIDYSIYDSDMVYIQEHADKAAEYNAALKSGAIMTASIGGYSQWSWSSGIFSKTSKKALGMSFSYYFVPTTTALYINAEVTGVSATPYLAVNILNSDGSLTYVGSYDITSTGSNTYQWTNYRRSVTKGTKYVLSLWSSSSNWSYASIDIYKTSM